MRRAECTPFVDGVRCRAKRKHQQPTKNKTCTVSDAWTAENDWKKKRKKWTNCSEFRWREKTGTDQTVVWNRSGFLLLRKSIQLNACSWASENINCCELLHAAFGTQTQSNRGTHTIKINLRHAKCKLNKNEFKKISTHIRLHGSVCGIKPNKNEFPLGCRMPRRGKNCAAFTAFELKACFLRVWNWFHSIANK